MPFLILAFIVSKLLSRVYDLPIVLLNGGRLPPRGWLYEQVWSAVCNPHVAATACVVLFVVAVVVLLSPLP